jgi:S1/P1 nuclease
MNTRITVAVLSVVTAWSALAFGAKGHRVIAEAAQLNLTTQTKSNVQAILGSISLSDAAVWPDEIKNPNNLSGSAKAEATAFNLTHKNNRAWHYVNLPLGTTSMPSNSQIAHNSNIVQIISKSINVLEGKSTMMSKKHALRWLVHLVGDLHQPLHVGCGYYLFDEDDHPILVTDPLSVIPGRDDNGGNLVELPGSKKLHSFWDNDMVNHVESAHGGTTLLAALKARIDAGEFAKTTGSYKNWHKKWAMRSVKLASSAYEGIRLEQRVTTGGSAWHIEAAWDDDNGVPNALAYKTKHQALAETQLALAAFNLAELLNRIKWQ